MSDPIELKDWKELDLDQEIANQNANSEKLREWASFYHQAFVQNDAGARLLEHWTQSTIMQPIVQENDSQFAAGIREGMARLIRGIHQQIKLAEKQD